MVGGATESSAPVSVTANPAEGAPFTVHRSLFRATLVYNAYNTPVSVYWRAAAARKYCLRKPMDATAGTCNILMCLANFLLLTLAGGST
eukprot:145185-Chlamydomonas_euryale.AAC.2